MLSFCINFVSTKREQLKQIKKMKKLIIAALFLTGCKSQEIKPNLCGTITEVFVYKGKQNIVVSPNGGDGFAIEKKGNFKVGDIVCVNIDSTKYFR